jgi:hypothetical protein
MSSVAPAPVGKGLYAGPGEGDGGSLQHRVNVEAAEIVWRGGVRR